MNHSISVLSELHRGAMVLTPNNRLAHQLLDDYSAHYQTHLKPLAKPHCLPYHTFLVYAYQQMKQASPFQTHPVLLNQHQQRYLWRTIIDEDLPYELNEGMIDLVHTAWAHCHAWQVDMQDYHFKQASQTQQFQRWVRLFKQQLTQRQAITLEMLPDFIRQSEISLPQSTIIWSCFDEFTPAQLRLQHSLQKQGFKQHYDDLLSKPIHAHCLPAEDQQEEYQQMMQWISHRLEQGDQRIAIVVPELQQEGARLQRLFTKQFPATAFNMSLGTVLHDVPMVSIALHYLQLNLDYLSADNIILLLQSAFITGSQHEHVARSQLVQDSTMMKEVAVPWTRFLEHIAPSCPQLLATLQHLNPYPKKDTPGAWAQHFKDRLTLIGFPGDYPLDSKHYQCFNRFVSLFDELMSLNTVTTVMTQEEALSALIGLSKTTVFQIKQPKSAIVILGFLEASGCTFDSIWITGLNDHCLPQKTSFSPFIPIPLQRHYALPHTSERRELQLAQQTLNRLGFACQRIVYSYATLLNDIPQHPCSLISDCPILPKYTLAATTSTSGLTPFEDVYLLPPESLESLSGGTALLASQAKCPFQAFAAHRLKAKAAPLLSDGLDAIERGQIIHRILEALWLKLTNQSTLLTIDRDVLDTYLDEIIQTTLEPLRSTRDYSFNAVTQAVEIERLKRLIHLSLEWEKQRPAFEIAALEQKHTLYLAGIPFQARIDRMDRLLKDSTKIVIDYKSSLPSSKPWYEERPESPQLLFYALLDQSITSLLFIQLKTGRITLSGLSQNSDAISTITTIKPEENWEVYQERWKQQLTDLAEEIKIGRCEPHPNKNSTCAQCAYASLCRSKQGA